MILSKSAIRQRTESASSISGFAKHMAGIKLYSYQRIAAQAIINSVFDRDGNTFVIIFSRQSGKDEILALIILFLLLRFIKYGAEIVCAQPTFKPQTVTAMERLRRRGQKLGKNLKRIAGYIMRIGESRASYFSAEPSASQVGATADRLLIMNEAQDIDPAIYDKRFSPMAASGNATRVFSGTSWTSSTLLSREKRAALEAEKLDGIQRVFIVDAIQISKSNPYYKKHVDAEILKLGRNHPFIRTQYFCEEIDAQAGMFNAARLALMQGDQPGVSVAEPGVIYAFLLDVAGQDEARLAGDLTAPLTNPGRDSVSLTIASIDMSSIELLQAPTYRFAHRQQWVGQNHTMIFGKLKSLVESWKPQHIVIDATGVGEGLWAMLDNAFPDRVIAVKFSQKSKSEIGWRYIAIIETGRARDCCQTDAVLAQYVACQSEILPGPAKTLRWGVPDGARGSDGELIHDDYLLADALIAEIDRLEWTLKTEAQTVQAVDPLVSMESYF